MKGIVFLLSGIAAGLLVESSVARAESLKEVVSGVVTTHPQVLSAKSRWQAQQEAIGVARAGYWPTLDIAAGVGRQKREVSTQPDGAETQIRRETSVTVRQNLFSGFNTLNSVLSAKQRSMAEQWRVKTTAEELGLQVVDAFLKVLERRDQVKLAVDNLELHDEIYQRIQRRTIQGVARSSDLTQIEGRRARANANLISARNNLLDAESEYHSLVGTKPGPLDQPTHNIVIPNTLGQALQRARKHHPGIKAAGHDIESSQAQYQSTRSALLPTLDLEIDKNRRLNADGIEGTTNDYVAMIRVRYNLFRGGGDRFRILESAWRVEESRAQKDRTMRNTEQRLRVAWAAFEFTGQQKQFLKLHQDSSKDTVAAYREQFNIGKRTLLDLLDGENELFQSSQNLTSAIYQEAFARYRILEAMGQLLETLSISQPSE